MISRRNFLKIIGIVPIMLTMPMPNKPIDWGNEPPVMPPLPPMPEFAKDEFHFYSGASTVGDIHIGMANAPWRSLNPSGLLDDHF